MRRELLPGGYNTRGLRRRRTHERRAPRGRRGRPAGESAAAVIFLDPGMRRELLPGGYNTRGLRRRRTHERRAPRGRRGRPADRPTPPPHTATRAPSGPRHPRATCPGKSPAFPAVPETVAAHRLGGNAPGGGRAPSGGRSPAAPHPRPRPPPLAGRRVEGSGRTRGGKDPPETTGTAGQGPPG